MSNICYRLRRDVRDLSIDATPDHLHDVSKTMGEMPWFLLWVLIVMYSPHAIQSCRLNHCLCLPTRIICAHVNTPTPIFTSREKLLVDTIILDVKQMDYLMTDCHTFPALRYVQIHKSPPTSYATPLPPCPMSPWPHIQVTCT